MKAAFNRLREGHRRSSEILAVAIGGAVAAVGPFAPARAQMINSYFPSGNSGFDQQLGVTVQMRARPLYEPAGIQVGSFIIRPDLDQSFAYDTAPLGAGSPESWISRTSASASVGSIWSRDGIGGDVGVDHNAYLSLSNVDYTDWHVGLTGAYTIGDGQLVGSYSHQTYHQLGNALGSVATATPLSTQTDSAQLSYTFNFGRFAITPDISGGLYRFGTATINGVQLNQQYLDYDSVAGGVTTRYSLSDAGGLLLVLRAMNSHYIHPQPGQPSSDSTSFTIAAGIDYQAKGPWRYQVLVGMEQRQYAASEYPSRTMPIIQSNVIWTPTELTTVIGTVSRTIAAAASAESSGFALTQAQLRLDHELRRNVILEGRASIAYAEYFQAGDQTNASVGAGVTWLLNRNLRLSLNYDFTSQTAPGSIYNPSNPNTVTSGSYTQNVVALALHVAF